MPLESPADMRSIAILTCVFLMLAAQSAGAQKVRTGAAKAKVVAPTGKTPLRVRLGRSLERLGAKIRGSSRSKSMQPAKTLSEAERLLGASHDAARLVTNPEGIPELARAMGRMRAYHDALRAASSRPALATDPILRFENVERLTSGTSVVGYRFLMVNHNGLHAVATTVFVKPDGTIAGVYGGVPGKLLGKDGVFDYDSRQGYERAAVERLAE